MDSVNIAKDKIKFLQKFAEENGFIFGILSNGVNLSSEEIIFTYYSGQAATYCVDNRNGKIKKGHGFDGLKSELTKYMEHKKSGLIEVSIFEALKILKNGESVFYKCEFNGSIEAISDLDSISSIFDIDKFYKKLEVKINGKTFTNKQDALNAINEIFGEHK